MAVRGDDGDAGGGVRDPPLHPRHLKRHIRVSEVDEALSSSRPRFDRLLRLHRPRFLRHDAEAAWETGEDCPGWLLSITSLPPQYSDQVTPDTLRFLLPALCHLIAG